jgi:RNA polymerase sigma-70 factor (ECF subfamily)
LWAARRLGEPAAAGGPAVTDRDDDLIRRALGGDRQAFDDIYRRHVDTVWRRLGRLLGPDPEREDLVQHIFLEVFRGLDRFRGEAAFATFLHRVVLNMAFDHLKRRRRRPTTVSPEQVEQLSDGAASPEARAAERERLAAMAVMLDRLKPKKRIAFILRVVEGLSLEEIATLVDATPAAVAQRVRHAQAEIEALLARRQRRGEA